MPNAGAAEAVAPAVHSPVTTTLPVDEKEASTASGESVLAAAAASVSVVQAQSLSIAGGGSTPALDAPHAQAIKVEAAPSSAGSAGGSLKADSTATRTMASGAALSPQASATPVTQVPGSGSAVVLARSAAPQGARATEPAPKGPQKPVVYRRVQLTTAKLEEIFSASGEPVVGVTPNTPSRLLLQFDALMLRDSGWTDVPDEHNLQGKLHVFHTDPAKTLLNVLTLELGNRSEADIFVDALVGATTKEGGALHFDSSRPDLVKRQQQVEKQAAARQVMQNQQRRQASSQRMQQQPHQGGGPPQPTMPAPPLQPKGRGGGSKQASGSSHAQHAEQQQQIAMQMQMQQQMAIRQQRQQQQRKVQGKVQAPQLQPQSHYLGRGSAGGNVSMGYHGPPGGPAGGAQLGMTPAGPVSMTPQQAHLMMMRQKQQQQLAMQQQQAQQGNAPRRGMGNLPGYSVPPQTDSGAQQGGERVVLKNGKELILPPGMTQDQFLRLMQQRRQQYLQKQQMQQQQQQQRMGIPSSQGGDARLPQGRGRGAAAASTGRGRASHSVPVPWTGPSPVQQGKFPPGRGPPQPYIQPQVQPTSQQQVPIQPAQMQMMRQGPPSPGDARSGDGPTQMQMQQRQQLQQQQMQQQMQQKQQQMQQQMQQQHQLQMQQQMHMQMQQHQQQQIQQQQPQPQQQQQQPPQPPLPK